MNELDLSLIDKKLLTLKNELEVEEVINEKILSKINDDSLLHFLKLCINEVEYLKRRNYKRSLLSIRLVNQFLKIVKKCLANYELRSEKEDLKLIIDELNNEIEECLLITSKYIVQVSRSNYLRGLLIKEFPNILIFLLSIASSNLINLKIRCEMLEASKILMNDENETKISESIQLRVCLYIEENGLVLKKLWESINEYKKLFSFCFKEPHKFKSSLKKKNLYSENEILLFVSSVLDIYANILHFYRYLADEILIKSCIKALTEKNIDLLLNLTVSPNSKISFQSSIILRSLLLDSDELEFKIISDKCKLNINVLFYIIRIMEIFNEDVRDLDDDNKSYINHWVLLAQIISILSQYDIEVFDFVSRLFPKKFIKIFDNKWFTSKKINLGFDSTINMLPWFPINCTWYNINTNILSTDSDISREKFKKNIIIDFLIFLEEEIPYISSNVKKLIVNSFIKDKYHEVEIFVNYIKNISNKFIDSLMLNQVLTKYKISYIHEFLTKCCKSISCSRDLMVNYCNSMVKDDKIKEGIIRRYPDFTWFIFWELCRHNYEDQLDLIWNNNIRSNIITTLLIEIDKISTFPRNSCGWKLTHYYPKVPILSKELQISESIYFRLLIPTLLKISETQGLFKKLLTRQINEKYQYLILESQKVDCIGSICGYKYKINDENNINTNKIKRNKIDEFNEPNNFKIYMKCFPYKIMNYFNSLRCEFGEAVKNELENCNNNQNKKLIAFNDNIDEIVINNQLNDWEIIDEEIQISTSENHYLHYQELNKYLDEKLFKMLLSSKIPYIECIDNCEKIRLLLENLFQKIISETSFIIKSYMFYGYIYYIIVFNEYILGQQVTGHIQYLILLLNSKNKNEHKIYRNQIIYILHIILTLYEEVRKEFVNIGGINIIKETIFDYQKSWSITKQLNIYNNNDIFENIIEDYNNERKLNWNKYIKILICKEKSIDNYKLFKQIEDYNIIENLFELDSINESESYSYFSNPNYKYENNKIDIFIIKIPDFDNLINDSMIYEEVYKSIINIKKEDAQLKTHIQYMNMWTLIINEDQLRSSVKDYLQIDEEEKLVSEIPSEITSENCLNSFCVTPNNKLIKSNHFDLLVDTVEKNNFKKIKNQVLRKMYENDRINYNELLYWLITINNCIIQSKLWLSFLTNEEIFDTVKYLIRIILTENIIKNPSDCNLNLNCGNNFHIYWTSKILIKILMENPIIILKMLDNNIIEVLLFSLLRFNTVEKRILYDENEYIIDEMIILLKLCIINMNNLEKEKIYFKEKKLKINKCNEMCNIIDGCIYGDTICLILNIIEKMNISNLIEIDELRMIDILGYGIYYTSRYIPIPMLEVLNFNTEYEEIYKIKNDIILFKKILYKNTNGIRIKWNKIDRMKLLMKLSDNLYINGLEIDINEENELIFDNNSVNNRIKIIEKIINENNRKGLNIYGYYLDNLIVKLVENNKIFFQEIESCDEIFIEWLNISRENRNKLIDIIEMNDEDITSIYKYNFDRFELKDKLIIDKSYRIFLNLWNISNYYLFIYLRYFFLNKNYIEEIEENKYLLVNIINILKFQLNLLYIGISYIKDYRIKIKNQELSDIENMETVFNQFIDKYYQLINNKENCIFTIHINVSQIIAQEYLINNYHNIYINKIYIYSLKISNIMREYNKVENINNNELGIKEYEKKLLAENLLKFKNQKNGQFIGFKQNSSILLLLLNDDEEDNHSIKKITNLLLYSIYIEIYNRNSNFMNESEYDDYIFDVLINYLIKERFHKSDQLTIILMNKIVQLYFTKIKYKEKGLEIGILPKLLQELLMTQYNNTYIKIVICETLSSLYSIYHFAMNEKSLLIQKIFKSLLTPPLCEILGSININKKINIEDTKFFIKTINSEVITSKIIWTKGMFNQLKEWCEIETAKAKHENNCDYGDVDYRQRYYLNVNKDINSIYEDLNYDYREENYVSGIYVLYFMLGNNFSIKKQDNEINNVHELFNNICELLRQKNELIYNSQYLYLLYKLSRLYLLKKYFESKDEIEVMKKNIATLTSFFYDNNNKVLNTIIKFILQYNEINSVKYQQNYIYYILLIVGIIEEKRENEIEIQEYLEKKDYIEDEYMNIIMMERYKLIIDILLYIQEEYIFNNKRDIGLEVEYNNILVITINFMRKLLVMDERIDQIIEYQHKKIILIINLLIMLFWYDNEKNHNEQLKHPKEIKEIIILSIKIIRNELIVKKLFNERIKEIIEIIIYPLSKSFTKKVKKLFTQEDYFSIESKMKENIKKLMFEEKSFIGILKQKRSSLEFLNWFTGDHDELMIKWNGEIKQLLFNNLKAIQKKIIHLKSNNKIYDSIKIICKKQYYKNILNEEIKDEYNINTKMNFNIYIKYCKEYILLILIIKEINNLTSLILSNNNKSVSIISKLLINKYKYFRLLMENISSYNNINKDFNKNHLDINENNYFDNSQKSNLVNIQDEIKCIGNIHPYIRVPDQKITQNTNKNEFKEREEGKNIDKFYGILILENMMRIILIEQMEEKNIKELKKTIFNIFNNILLRRLDCYNYNCNNKMRLDLLGDILDNVVINMNDDVEEFNKLKSIIVDINRIDNSTLNLYNKFLNLKITKSKITEIEDIKKKLIKEIKSIDLNEENKLESDSKFELEVGNEDPIDKALLLWE